MPELSDVNTDAQDKGLQTSLVIDHDAAARLGISQSLIDNTLNDLFGQRLVSTIYEPLNQYHVVMEAAPQYWQSPETLKDVFIIAPGPSQMPSTLTSAYAQQNEVAASGIPSTQVPLASFAHYEQTFTPLAVNHQGQFAASTISFNLPVGISLSDATRAIEEAMLKISVPTSIHGSFQGTAKAFQASLDSQPILILTAIITVYLVLGILYESLVHPLTILSTLPSAGVGAILALMAFGSEFSIIALIGVILLIGIVKKNAIMMIDFAIDAERREGLSPRDAIHKACLLRFRPIMMTTMAALFGAIPLAIGFSDGSEFRRPLGIAIVGGLILSQLLTLYTTPVVYLYLDRFRLWCLRFWQHPHSVGAVSP
ncbi:MAG: efflux RND transporter permease subunit [Nitrosomonadales bacterium]